MILEAKGIVKIYNIAGTRRRILDGIDLALDRGDIVSLTGTSGCGKTTLLHVISGIASPDHGSVRINGKRMAYAFDLLASRMRNRGIGFIFQTFRLLPNETVRTNVLLPARIRGLVDKRTKEYAEELLDRLKIYKFRNTKAAVLSGGQKQRVAIARALVNRPDLILADEPTANLDRKTAAGILDVIFDLRMQGKAVLVVTHDGYMHERSDRVYAIEDGKLEALS
jgi:putative ABC transport system ATP-binding protein